MFLLIGAVLGASGTYVVGRLSRREERRHAAELAEHERDRLNREATRADLDETRRLLLVADYALRLTSEPISVDLVATITNAMATHSKILPSNEAETFAHALFVARNRGTTHEVLERITAYVADIDRRLALL